LYYDFVDRAQKKNRGKTIENKDQRYCFRFGVSLTDGQGHVRFVVIKFSPFLFHDRSPEFSIRNRTECSSILSVRNTWRSPHVIVVLGRTLFVFTSFSHCIVCPSITTLVSLNCWCYYFWRDDWYWI